MITVTAIALLWCPLFAQDVAAVGGYNGITGYSARKFIPAGQVAANGAADASTSTLDNLPKVGDTQEMTLEDGTKANMVLKSIKQDGNQVSLDWEPVDGNGGGIGEAINVDGPGFVAGGTDTTTTNPGTTETGNLDNDNVAIFDGTNTTDATNNTDATTTDATTNTDATNTTNNTTQDATNGATTVIDGTYDSTAGTITYKAADGTDKTVNIADIGLSKDWMTALTAEGDKVSLTMNSDGTVKLITGTDSTTGAKKWEYDPSAHLVAHYDGDKGSEKCTVVTSDEDYTTNYVWASKTAADPGKGPDGHMVVQRFNYDSSGNLQTVDYFAWTSGNRGGLHPEIHKQVYGVLETKGRYMYRQDTVLQSSVNTDSSSSTATDSSSVTANCTDNPPSSDNIKVSTKYFNDPFPVDWDPVKTGTVTKDEYGQYWLETSNGESYLLTARDDGFDANKNGKVGADEMNSVDWESLVGKEITVRGHMVADDSQGGVYHNGEKAAIFEVCDISTTNSSEDVANFEKVAAQIDPTQEPDGNGLIGTATGPGKMGVVNVFGGQMPTADTLDLTDVASKFTNGLAKIYVNNVADLASIREFATPDMETALKAAETARGEANNAAQNANAATDTTKTTTDATNAATDATTTTTNATNANTDTTTNAGTTTDATVAANAVAADATTNAATTNQDELNKKKTSRFGLGTF